MNKATRYGIPKDIGDDPINFRIFPELKISEGCKWHKCEDLFTKIFKQYKHNFKNFLHSNEETCKKNKELFFSCMLGMIVAAKEGSTQERNEIYVGIPDKDCGWDNYLRETNRKAETIITYPIQNTIFDSSKPNSGNLESAIMKKCQKYGAPKKKEGILFVEVLIDPKKPISYSEMKSLQKTLRDNQKNIIFKQIFFIMAIAQKKIHTVFITMEYACEMRYLKFDCENLQTIPLNRSQS